MQIITSIEGQRVKILVKSLFYHVDLGDQVQTLRVLLHVLKEVRKLELLLVYQLLVSQSNAILHCYLSRVEMIHVQFLPIL